jgi:two-component system sensor histidine kinase KdpD
MVAEDRAKTFLQMIRRSQRGRLKIYLGYGPGVGKTYLMLQEAHRLQSDAVDVVVGVVETHGRADTARLVDGLEVVPRRVVEYRGIVIDEMDVDAVLRRRPQVVLVDELAHTNVPGSRHAKRYEDVRELLAAGIHVVATLNVQHLESLYNTVERLIGVKVRERLPDAVVAEADQIVNVDLTPEDLQSRLNEGKIYPKERVDAALENFFRQGNLEHLRELTMREIASQIDFKRREVLDESDKVAPDQIMVCLASKGPNSARLLRAASRIAGRLNRTWYAVYVQTPKEDPTVIDATTQRLLADTLTLANQLGATVFTFKGEDVVDTILKFASEYRVGHIVIGRPRRLTAWQRCLGKRSVAEELVVRAEGFTVVVVDAEARPGGAPPADDKTSEEVSGRLRTAMPESPGHRIADVLDEGRVALIDQPVTKSEVLRRLVDVIHRERPDLDPQAVLVALERRELQGSTFLNESVAVPHARIEGLASSEVALAVTKGGVADVASERPIEAVFMLLAPVAGGAADLRLLTKAIRVFQDLGVRRDLTDARTPAEVLRIIGDAEPDPLRV